MNIHVSPDEPIDLTNCDREPIHVPGRVQSFGALLAFTPDWLVARASDNVSDMLGLDVADLAGRDVTEIFHGEFIHRLRGRLSMMGHADAVERLFAVDMRGNGQLFDVAMHVSDQQVVVELEPSSSRRQDDYTGYVRPMIERIRRADDVESLCRVAAKQVKALIGFDRVMVYKFAPDGSGHVIAEAREARQTPFLGLRYPASDIPKQARALYKRSLLRIISDVNDTGVDIHPVLDSKGRPLDLSLSSLRAVSPIHLEYLRNMGVAASMSISLMVRGKLWGLIACHHDTPIVLSYEMRSAAELFAQLFGFVLAETESDTARLDDARARVLHDRIMAELADGRGIEENFKAFSSAIGTVIDFSGIALVTDGRIQMSGKTPTREQIMPLVRFLNTTEVSQIFATDQLPALHPPARDYSSVASGILALPVSRKPRDYVMLFREEFIRDVRWGGNPDKPVEPGPNGIRLTPRKSFEAWTQTVHGQSHPWSDQEMRAAESLRITLLEVVLRMTDNSNRERARSQEQQELLIAELNHRVRNILNLIRGLISQSAPHAAGQSGDNTGVAEFTEVIGGRIHALARAHDQITNENWSPASVRELIDTEMSAYLGDDASRVVVVGSDALIKPAAFTTLSLVIHELVTNAVKYGALSNTSGQVDIALSEGANGGLSLDWRESGGPPVSAPKRRGFGSTITERSLAYELKGSSEITYDLTGLKGHFRIPPDYVHAFVDSDAAAPVSSQTSSAEAVSIDGPALVVEDNMIIALDAEDLLETFGASEVHTAPSVHIALQVLDAVTPTIALLDVNLGNETSERVADQLSAMGVPFMFTTGYGDRTSLSDKFPDAPFLRKPYDTDMIGQALRVLQARARG